MGLQLRYNLIQESVRNNYHIKETKKQSFGNNSCMQVMVGFFLIVVFKRVFKLYLGIFHELGDS